MAYDRTWPLYVILDSIETGGSHSPALNGSWNDCTNGGSTTPNGHHPTTPEHENHNQLPQGPQTYCIKVRGDWSIGQVMVATTNAIPINQDWSDYAFWWAKKRTWLKSTRMTLDQADVHANDKLHFTPMHKPLRLQMPDLSVVELPVDFSTNVLSTVAQLASSTLSIRHHEELSLARPLTRAQLKRNQATVDVGQTLQQRPLTPTIDASSKAHSSSSLWLGKSSPSRSTLNGNGTLGGKSNGTSAHQLNVSYGTVSSNNSLNSLSAISAYSLGSPENGRIGTSTLLRPKSSLEKARLNAAWLDSSVSLYEQEVAPYDLLLLRYKFFDFFDLSPKVDFARVNYIYEQLRWAIVTEEVACSEDEMITLAAINLQVALASGTARFKVQSPTVNGGSTNGTNASPFFYDTVDSPVKSNGGNGFFRTNSNGNGNGYTNGNGVNGHNGHYGNGFANGNGNGHQQQQHYNHDMSPVDEIDSALEDLEKTLEGTYLEPKSKPNGSSSNGGGNGVIVSNGNGFSNGSKSPMISVNGNGRQHNNILVVPELADKLKITSTKGGSSSTMGGTLSRIKFLNNEKSFFVVLRDTTLSFYKSAEVVSSSTPVMTLNVHRCDVKPDVLASAKRFCFTLIESRPVEGGAGGIQVVSHSVKCRDEEQYSRWYTACRLASSGRTMAHASYGEEVKKTLRLLQIQTSTKGGSATTKGSSSPAITPPSPVDLDRLDIPLEEYVSPRLLKRKSKEQILRKIKNVHGNFAHESPIEAQMTFIRTCQSLRDYGITLFVIRSSKSKKEELLGVAPTKLLLLDINTGAVLRSWRYSALIDWNVNWEVKKMTIHFNEETIEFACLSADCKVIHEFIGGYIALSMRTKENDGRLSEEDFLKLTGGWHQVPQDEDEEDQMNQIALQKQMQRNGNGAGRLMVPSEELAVRY